MVKNIKSYKELEEMGLGSSQLSHLKEEEWLLEVCNSIINIVNKADNKDLINLQEFISNGWGSKAGNLIDTFIFNKIGGK